ncbi:hypothetical protein ES707_04061 [subsurface metagenome]
MLSGAPPQVSYILARHMPHQHKLEIPLMVASIAASTPNTEVILLGTNQAPATEDLPRVNVAVRESNGLIPQGDKCPVELFGRHLFRQCKGSVLLMMTYPEPDTELPVVAYESPLQWLNPPYLIFCLSR